MALTIQLDDGRIILVRGRAEWALIKLIEAGSAGCSIFDSPAPRWSSYVYRLRELGVAIETVREPHSGPFAGHHGRYSLRIRIGILKKTGDES
jgi:hypothetical protein